MDCTFLTDLGKFNYRVAGVIVQGSKILCQQVAADSNYFLPGGRVAFGERAEDAILREISEELGAEATILRQLWLHENFFTEETTLQRFHEICLYFLLEVPGLPQGQLQASEGIYSWLPLESLPHTPIYPRFLREALGNLPEGLTLLTTAEPEYRLLTISDMKEDLLRDFIRRQEVTEVRRNISGCWQTIPCPFVDDWTGEQRSAVIWILGEILARGGKVIGAWVDGKLKGLIGLEATPMGSRGQYRELCGFWVSADCRGQGIGTKLFRIAKLEARKLGAKKLYISSHPAVETQAFYRAMGCREAEEYSPEHVAREPFDCQIECDF